MNWKQKINLGLDAVIHPSKGPKFITIKQYWNKYRVRTPYEEIECSKEDLEKVIQTLKGGFRDGQINMCLLWQSKR